MPGLSIEDDALTPEGCAADRTTGPEPMRMRYWATQVSLCRFRAKVFFKDIAAHKNVACLFSVGKRRSSASPQPNRGWRDHAGEFSDITRHVPPIMSPKTKR